MYATFFLPYVVSTLGLLAIQLYRLRRDSSDNRNLITVLSAVLPISYFFFIILSFSSPAAFIDDFNLLDSFHRMLTEDHFTDRLRAFFEQVNEHRFAFERVVMYLIYLVRGEPSPQVQVIIGNLFLFGILGLFHLIFKQTGKPAAYFTPVVLLLFSLVYYENVYWAIAAIQNTSLIFFAMLTAFGLSLQSAKGKVIGLSAALLASFVSGSGIAVWVMGALVIALQKNYRFLVPWLLAAACVVSFYFTFDYTFFPKDRSALWQHPLKNLWFFFSFLGGLFYQDIEHGHAHRFYPDVAASVLAGSMIFIICLCFLVVLATGRLKRETGSLSILAGIILFLFATGAMLVISRPVSINVIWGGEFLSQRYLIFAAVLWAAAYLAVLILVRNTTGPAKGIFALALVGSVVFNLGSYYLYIPKLAIHHATLELDKWYTENQDAMLLSFGAKYEDRLFWNHPTAFRNLLADLRSNGLYDPAQPVDPQIFQAMEHTLEAGIVQPLNWKTALSKKEVVVHGKATNPRVTVTVESTSVQARPVYLILRSDRRSFVLPAVPVRSAPRELLSRLNFWSSRYAFEFREFKFPAGAYALWVVGAYDREGLKPVDTGQIIHLRSEQPSELSTRPVNTTPGAILTD
ncbi:hypothetical protein GCM10023091_15370 [Ravibacter arvi]|uniref:Glycosyltransferase RgtA/B/C/D-like domain-containing protein n=1 Tax=Ravibacter arvi TaxID=2051041 RepID=A0ABP8LVZ4_9BACT